LLARQVIDPSSRWCGSFPDDDGLHSPHSAAAILDAFTAAFLHAGSKFHASALLLERLSLAARHLVARQHENGTIDLPITNFNSPPDTAFAVHNVGTAACLARRHALAQVAALTEPFLRKAGGALLRGGGHTPNHRWVVGYALAQIHELFPDTEYVRRIDQWLAEGVDLDADGQFAERSTLVYNAISDRALVVMAAKLNRPELLEPVRRNLEAMLWLLHPGYEVVTEISRRQDANQRGTMASYWFPLKYLAVKDGNGKLAALAREFEAQSAGLSAMMEYPETTQPGPYQRHHDHGRFEQFLHVAPRCGRGECRALRLRLLRQGPVCPGDCFETCGRIRVRADPPGRILPAVRSAPANQRAGVRRHARGTQTERSVHAAADGHRHRDAQRFPSAHRGRRHRRCAGGRRDQPARGRDVGRLRAPPVIVAVLCEP
jgi:hypothetical protein